MANSIMTMERRIKLKTLNSHITCKICRGYFIDATTVTECLHTFCKSCLVKHLEDNNTCPTCTIVIHQSHPLQYISFDRTMQDIVYKLVPDLQKNETSREREFYRARGIPCPKDALIGEGTNGRQGDRNGNHADDAHADATDYHRRDEQVNVCLECTSANLKTLKRRFLRCSSQATITHLKKLIAKKVLNNIDKFREIDLLCNNELLGKDHTLKFVYVTRWRFRDPPLRLQYRPMIELVAADGAGVAAIATTTERSLSRLLGRADEIFVDAVERDLRIFAGDADPGRVLVFPPVSNYRRFLIHQTAENLDDCELTTFSIGQGDERRTVVCYGRVQVKQKQDKESRMVVENNKSEPTKEERGGSGGESSGLYRPPQVRMQQQHSQQQSHRENSVRVRRPDRAVYIPKGRRTAAEPPSATKVPSNPTATETAPTFSPDSDSSIKPSSPTQTIDSPKTTKSSRAKTKQRTNAKAQCNVYTPPHARTTSSQNVHVDLSDTSDEPPKEVPNSVVDLVNNSCEDAADGVADTAADIERADNVATDLAQHVSMDWSYDKDEDNDQKELIKASEEINRSNRRLIKQSFVSDVLVISDPQTEVKSDVDTPSRSAKCNRDEEDWDAMFDENGDWLGSDLMEEITIAVGEVAVQKPRMSYENYLTNAPQAFSHVLEVYNFPAEFTTNDLLSVFSDFKDTGFEIKWVDDNHALAVFSSTEIAAQVLAYNHPMVKTRPLHEATLESRTKAKKSAEFLRPYRPRPETCAALARRLVSGALGVRLPTHAEERIQEKQKISLAREKKRLAAMHREAAWDGSLTSGDL